MQNAGLEEAQAGIKIAERNINSLRYADDTIPMAESREELKSSLMKVKKESEQAGLKLNIQKIKIMAYSPIQFSSVQLLNCVRLFVTPGAAACQASLSISNSHESRQIGSGRTDDDKSEHQHSRNQWTKMDWSGWI